MGNKGAGNLILYTHSSKKLEIFYINLQGFGDVIKRNNNVMKT